jgi:hypothetical protein
MRWIFLLLLMANLLLLVLIFQAEKELESNPGHAPVGQLDVMPISKYEQLEKGFLSEDPPEPPEPAGTGASQNCSTLGPLTNRDRAEALSAELAPLGVASRLRSEMVKTIRDYWVIQTPEITEGHQAEDIARLRRSGITDVSPIRDGQYRGGISLGIYRQRTNAIKRRQQVDRFGLTAEIVERGDKQEVYWVDASEDLFNALSDNERDSLMRRYIPITIEASDCR